MLSEFHHTWNCHLAHITTVKNRIKLLKLSTQPVHSAPYRAGPKTLKFEKAEIDKILNKNITKPAQTEWAFLHSVHP